MNFPIVQILLILQFTAACQSSATEVKAPTEDFSVEVPDALKEPIELAAKPLLANSSDCKSANWRDGKFYEQGSRVRYEDKLYVAVHANNYDTPPVSGSWFWEALAACP